MKTIRGFDSYLIREDGYIYSNYTKKLLALVKQNTGYLSVTLYKNKKGYVKPVHRLVAIAFIQNDNNYKCVNHKDGNRHNNNVSNLEWCTHSYNSLHSFRELGRVIWNKGITSQNLSDSKKGSKNPAAKEVINIYSGFVYETISLAANDKNLSKNTIYSRMVRSSLTNEFIKL